MPSSFPNDCAVIWGYMIITLFADGTGSFHGVRGPMGGERTKIKIIKMWVPRKEVWLGGKENLGYCIEGSLGNICADIVLTA